MADQYINMSAKPDNLNYDVAPMNNGRYRMRQLQLNNIPQIQATLSANGSVLLEWVFPAREVFNPARSNIQYKVPVPAQGAGLCNWTFEDTFEICSSITMGTAAKPTDLMDLQFANNYVSVARKLDTTLADFETSDYTSGLHPSDSVAPASAVITPNANFFPPIATTVVGNPYGIAVGAYPCALTQREPAYARTAAANTAMVITRVVPFSALSHTIMAMDRDFVFAEDIYLRIMLAPSYKIGFTSTLANDPSSVPAPFATQPAITDIYVNAAMQEDELIKRSVLDKFERGDMKYIIPYQYGWRQTTAGAGQATVNVSVNRSYGKKLKRMLYVPFDGVESTSAAANKAYDHQNLGGAKISIYQTLIQSKPLQDQQTAVDTLDDWRLNKEFCRDSAIRNSACYYYNWFHMDSWSNPKRGKVLTPWENIYEGLDLTDANQTWTLNATVKKSLNHYVFAEFIREVHSRPVGRDRPALEVIVA